MWEHFIGAPLYSFCIPPLMLGGTGGAVQRQKEASYIHSVPVVHCTKHTNFILKGFTQREQYTQRDSDLPFVPFLPNHSFLPWCWVQSYSKSLLQLVHSPAPEMESCCWKIHLDEMVINWQGAFHTASDFSHLGAFFFWRWLAKRKFLIHISHKRGEDLFASKAGKSALFCAHFKSPSHTHCSLFLRSQT